MYQNSEYVRTVLDEREREMRSAALARLAQAACTCVAQGESLVRRLAGAIATMIDRAYSIAVTTMETPR